MEALIKYIESTAPTHSEARLLWLQLLQRAIDRMIDAEKDVIIKKMIEEGSQWSSVPSSEVYEYYKRAQQEKLSKYSFPSMF